MKQLRNHVSYHGYSSSSIYGYFSVLHSLEKQITYYRYLMIYLRPALASCTRNSSQSLGAWAKLPAPHARPASAAAAAQSSTCTLWQSRTLLESAAAAADRRCFCGSWHCCTWQMVMVMVCCCSLLLCSHLFCNCCMCSVSDM